MSSSEASASPSPSDSPTPPELAVSPSSGDLNAENIEVVSSEEASNFNNEFDEFVLAAETAIVLLNPDKIYALVYNYVKLTTPPDVEYSVFKSRCISAAMEPLLFLSFLIATTLSNNINVMSTKEIQEVKGGRKRKSGGGGKGKLPPQPPGRGRLSKDQDDYLLKKAKQTNPEKYVGPPKGDYYKSDLFVYTDEDLQRASASAQARAQAQAQAEAASAASAPDDDDDDDDDKDNGGDDDEVNSEQYDSLEKKLESARVKPAREGPSGIRTSNPRRQRPKQLTMMECIAIVASLNLLMAPLVAAVNHESTPGYNKYPIEIKNPHRAMARAQIEHVGAQNFMAGVTTTFSANVGLIAHQTVGIHRANSVAAAGINFLQNNVPKLGPGIASAVAPYINVVPTIESTMSPAAVVLGQNPAGNGVTTLKNTGTAGNQQVTYVPERELAEQHLAAITQYCAMGKGELNVDPKKCSFAYFEQLQQRLYRALQAFPALLRDVNAKYLDLMGKKCGPNMKVGKKIIIPAQPAVMGEKTWLGFGTAPVLKPATDARIEEVEISCFDPIRDAFNVEVDEDGKLVFLISEDATLAKVANYLKEDMPEECPIVDYHVVTGNMVTYKENIERYIVDFIKNPKLKKMIDEQSTEELKKKTVVKMFNKCLIWQFNSDVVLQLPDLIKELSDPSIYLNVKRPTDVPRAFMDENAAISLVLEQFRSFEHVKILTEEELEAEKTKQEELKASLGPKVYVPPIIPLDSRISSKQINDLYTEYWSTQTLAAKFVRTMLKPGLEAIGEAIVTTIDVTSKVAANSAGKIVKNVGAEFGLEGWQASLAGMSVFGIIGAVFGMAPFVAAAVPIGIGASCGVLKMIYFIRNQIRGSGRFLGAAVKGANQPAGGAGGCIRRNARSGGGGTKKKKIKTKIVKSKKRRLIYFTRRRSIIKKIRRSNKK